MTDMPRRAGEPAPACPVLPGRGASDYERYLRTDDLLELQKTTEERVHHDELLFQTVHQASELWLKLACAEVDEAAAALEQATPAPAHASRLLRRAVLSLRVARGHAVRRRAADGR